jgi:DNA repair protein RecO (recombination protein O)
MNQLVTNGIILNRTNYGEADRIITLLTPDQGKVRLIAKGVRKVKSKLAGGIELFSVSNITYIRGRKEIGTLISARLIKHYGDIVKDLNRTMLGYELIKQLDKATEDELEAEYFALLEQVFELLDKATETLSPPDYIEFVRMWFTMRLLRLGGHMPNLETDSTGQRLQADAVYSFSFDDMAFARAGSVGKFHVNEGQAATDAGSYGSTGQYGARHIKFLRLGFATDRPAMLLQIDAVGGLIRDLVPLIQTMYRINVH